MKIIALGVLAGAAPLAQADLLIFNNGDKLNGTLVEQNQDTIRFNSDSLGVVNVPASRAHVEASPKAGTKPAPASGRSTAQSALKKDQDQPTWADELKQSINTVIPGKISGRLDAGLTSTQTSSSTTQIISTGNFTIKSAPNTYDVKGFYYYTASTAADGSTSRSADRYGGDATYRRDFDDRLFFSDEAGYLRDFQANIDHQGQDTANLGYILWKSKNIELDVQAGPSERYTDADGVAQKWRTLGGGKETLTWNFSDSLRLEQQVHALAQMDEFKNQAWGMSAALINQLDRNLELSLKYSQSYNTIVGLNGARSEQVIALVLGVTF